MQTIQCPHCKKTFEPSDALASEYKDTIVAELENKYKKDSEKQQLEFEEKTVKKIKNELELKLKDQENIAKEEKEKRDKLQEEILERNKMIRELKDKDEQRKIEMDKKLEEQTEKIKLKAQEDATKESQVKLLEKEKQLQDALKEAEDMKRKLQQGSQQLQGETFELEFEKLLAQHYPNDKISPVGKGVKGGDVIHEVWDSKGNYAGKILWELKNTKLWSEGWIDKLKGDKRAINADEAILISDILPTEIKDAGFRNGVWVTKQNFVIPLADTMRAKLIQLFYAKKAAEGKGSKMEIIYNYLGSSEFANRVEAIIESFSSMQKEIEKEKRYFSNKWARDEKNLRQVIDNTYGMHGDLKGIMGNSLPQISGIDSEVIEIEVIEEQKLL